MMPPASRLAPSLPLRIPSLDGIRALSIALVFIGHLKGTQGFPAWINPPDLVATTGVRIFFIISGFLITSLLLREWDKTGRVSLRRFYLRRALRILPAFYAYILVVSLLAMAGWATILENDLLHAITFTMNYHHPHGWPLAHLWSLAVEEQFYFLWPSAFLLLRPKRAMIAAAVVVLLSPVLRLGVWEFFEGFRPYYGQQFELVADALASGCLLAGAYNVLGGWQNYQRILRSPYFWVVPVMLSILQRSDSPRIYNFAGQTIMNLCIVLIIERMVRYPATFTGRLLNTRPLCFVGTLSYSLYVWQQLFLDRHSTDWSTAFPVNLLFAVALALVSYYVVERPFLRFKAGMKRTAS